MITEIDASLLEKIADLTGKPVGAFNIRKDSGCEARQSTEHIAIDPQPEGKSGIIIRIKDGTKGEQCHIPVIISKSGVTEMVYNDFYVGENCDVEIVAGAASTTPAATRAAMTASTRSTLAKTPTCATRKSTTARATAAARA